MTAKRTGILSLALAITLTAFFGFTFGMNGNQAAAAVPDDETPVIPGYLYDNVELNLAQNNDVRTIRRLYWKIRHAEDLYGNATTVSDLDVRLYRSILEDESQHLVIRRWAIAGASDLYVNSPHVTPQHLEWLLDALIDIWANDPCAEVRDIADYVLVEEIGI